MKIRMVIFTLIPTIVVCMHKVGESNVTGPSVNSSDAKKDMYVIHAMVYQVGIITNKTNNETDTNIGNQEAVTYFHSNGSKIDFSNITSPLLTNVTAQSFVGILPDLPKHQNLKMANTTNNWNMMQPTGEFVNQRGQKRAEHAEYVSTNKLYKRSSEVKGNDVVKIVKGSVVVPKEVGVNSIALPPLLALNNNFTNIPVPIPNTSIVHYAKINTLIHPPGQ